MYLYLLSGKQFFVLLTIENKQLKFRIHDNELIVGKLI